MEKKTSKTNKTNQTKPEPSQDQEKVIEFEQVIDRGAGLDVHKQTVVATIQGKGLGTTTRTFCTYTASLRDLKAWLKENDITHVAMESRGVYWKPVINILGEDFKILLVNARHVKNVPGHKRDKKDSQWLAKLLLSGLLKGSFIPNEAIRALRDLTRYRTKLTQQISGEKNRLLKLLEDTNIKLSCVLTDPFGVSGRGIIEAIIEGKACTPSELLGLVNSRVKAKKEELVQALEGHIRDHHRFMLKTIMSKIKRLEQTLKEVDQQIEAQTKPYEQEKKLLQTIPGVGEEVAVVMVSEIGVDMDHFPSHKQLASWAGISPGNNQSGGKSQSSRITKGNKWLKSKLVEAGWGAARSKGTYLESKYRSLVSRKGSKKAVIAIGHKILVAAYYILKDKLRYKDLGYQYIENLKQGGLNILSRDVASQIETGVAQLGIS